MSERSNTNLESGNYLFSQEYHPEQTSIFGRSILDLFRAFSNNSMVAFVGSGTSVALGYPTWERFARDFVKHVVEQCKITLSDKSEDPKYRYSNRLAETMEEYQRLFDGSDPKKTPALFDMIALASEMAAELQRIRSESGLNGKAGSLPAQINGTSTGGKNPSPAGKTIKSVEDFYDTTFHMKEPCPYAELPRGRKWFDPVVRRMQDVLGALAGNAGGENASQGPMSIPPDYVAGDALVHALCRTRRVTAKSKSDDAASGQFKKLLGQQRASLDVLACLQGNWKINRFVTLNYDHEIERQLEDHTYPFFSLTPRKGSDADPKAGSTTGGPAADPRKSARSRLGERAETIDLCPKNTAELLLFAANFSPAHVQVLHLHGSVREPATMIVTDRDYNQRYFAQGAWPSVLGDGQELLFRGNAILFVGVGMNEDELLRPLRILAQAPSRDGRPVFTLLGSSSRAEDTALAVKLFQRYGIRTIFYGTELDQDHEFGDLKDHPLRKAYRDQCPKGDGSCDDLHDRTDLASLQEELDFLGAVQRVIKTGSDVIAPDSDRSDDRPDDQPVDEQTRLQEQARREIQYLEACDGLKTAIGKRCVPDDEAHQRPEALARKVGRFREIPTKKLPRLRLTPWHQDVFALLSLCLEERRFRSLNAAQLKALGAAVGSLQSAIRTRALLDALNFIALRARGWRRRWSRYPGHEHCPPAFRRLPDGLVFPRLLRRHIGMHDNIGIAEAFHKHAAATPIDDAVLNEINGCRMPVVIWQWPAGRGKGYLASLLASQPELRAPRRVVISFHQSCEFDSCFDLIADVIRLANDKSCRVDCVLTHVDTIFNKAARRPQLAEWDAMLRLLTTTSARHRKIRLIVLCEYPSTRDYFAALAGKDQHYVHASRSRAPYAESAIPRADEQKSDAQSRRDLGFVFARCKSRWLVLFLCQLIDWVEQGGRRRKPVVGAVRDTAQPAGTPPPDAEFVPTQPLLAAGHPANEFRQRLINDAWNRLRQTQDPRQRVAAVIDVAIAHFERHVIAYGKPAVRLQKILAFAILRNLFLLATPVRPELIGHFPEIREILKDYRATDAAQSWIDDAVALLEHLRLVIPLHGHHDSAQGKTRRIGLHGSTRSYLLSKKSLPFTHFGRREHAAITVLPVLAEDVVALEQDDFDFTRKLFQGLVAGADSRISEKEKKQKEDKKNESERKEDQQKENPAGDAGGSDDDNASDEYRVLPAECIRAAFGLLRGSMRLGTVLRAAATAESDHSPLDEYFRQLLSIRRAALRIASGMDPKFADAADPKVIDDAEAECATDADPDYSGKKAVFSWPLYEREWVWLFNEMGVVRLLQGDMRDACALFEQAIDFEEKRLQRENTCYEQLLYGKNRGGRFSVSRLRIFMNLSTAALERGAFDRITRIVNRDIANLRLHLPDLAPTAPTEQQDAATVSAKHRPHSRQPEKCGPHEHASASPMSATELAQPHRELEILTLVAGLIGARVQYLQGAIGGAEAWLRRHRRWVLDVGVHGLTAAFFKVYADVQQRKGETARTMKYLAIARTEAEASCRTDVILGVMLAEAEQARDTQAADSALQLRHHLGRLRKIEGEARCIGLAQVEATVCLVRARLYLGFGEYRSAREDIMSALTTTTSKGMRVKRIAALVILAALMATEDTTDTARHEALHLLTTARAEAERMGYKLAAINAMELEIVLNRRGSVEDWATSRARVAVDARTASSVAG
ncbi:MAG TPA: SIR2 family protein [Tahibacter sp.]|nr:SIR2 family protein [Tahibacter sp.]